MFKLSQRTSIIFTFLLLLVFIPITYADVTTTNMVYALDCNGDTTDSHGQYNALNDIVDYVSSPYDDQACDLVSANSDYIDMGDQNDYSFTDDNVTDLPWAVSMWVNPDSTTTGNVWTKSGAGGGFYDREWWMDDQRGLV